MKKKIASLELLRFFAAVAIMNFHFDTFLQVDNSYTKYVPILVEFFFMLTGFFMMKSLSQKENDTRCLETIPYVYRKARSIWPVYMLALCFAFVIRMVTNHICNVSEIVKQLFHFKWEFFMLHMTGFTPNPQFNTDYLSPVTWYISSMMIALVPAYFLAKQFGKKYSGVIAPLTAFIVYAYIMKHYQSIDVGNEYVGCILLGNIRAFAGISMGAFAYYMAKLDTEKAFLKSHRKAGNILNIIAWISIPCILILSKQFSGPDMLIYIFVYMLIIIQGYQNEGIVSRFLNQHCSGVWHYLGELSLYVYLMHTSILFFIKEFYPGSNGIKTRLLWFVTVLILSIACKLVVQKIKTMRIRKTESSIS